MASLTSIIRACKGGPVRPIKEIFHHPNVQLVDSFEDAFQDEKILLCAMQQRTSRNWHACVLHTYDKDTNSQCFEKYSILRIRFRKFLKKYFL